MRQRSLFLVICSLLLVFSIATALTAGQAKRAQPLYSEVVDKAFRFSGNIPAEFPLFQSRIVIRSLPASGIEWQVVALKKGSENYRVIRYGLKPATQSISGHYNAVLQEKPSASVDEILQGVNVEISEQKVDKSTVQLLNQLDNLSVPTKLSPDLCTDGITYELWIQTPSNEIHTSLSDCAYGQDTHSVPIIRWIRTVGAKLQQWK